MVGTLFKFLDLHIPFVSLVFELFFEQEERFVHLPHIFLLAGNAGLLFLVNRLVGFYFIQ